MHLNNSFIQIAELCLRLLDAAAPSSSSDGSSTASQSSKLAQLPESSKLAVRLHLLSLLFEVKPCAIWEPDFPYF